MPPRRPRHLAASSHGPHPRLAGSLRRGSSWPGSSINWQLRRIDANIYRCMGTAVMSEARVARNVAGKNCELKHVLLLAR